MLLNFRFSSCSHFELDYTPSAMETDILDQQRTFAAPTTAPRPAAQAASLTSSSLVRLPWTLDMVSFFFLLFGKTTVVAKSDLGYVPRDCWYEEYENSGSRSSLSHDLSPIFGKNAVVTSGFGIYHVIGMHFPCQIAMIPSHGEYAMAFINFCLHVLRPRLVRLT